MNFFSRKILIHCSKKESRSWPQNIESLHRAHLYLCKRKKLWIKTIFDCYSRVLTSSYSFTFSESIFPLTWNRCLKLPLLLLLSHFSCVWLCATPETAAHQVPLSLGFSRQEYWSGLPFPSPIHGSEKWKWSRSVVSDSSRPHGLQPTRLLRPWDFPGKSTGVGCPCLLRYILSLCMCVYIGIDFKTSGLKLYNLPSLTNNMRIHWIVNFLV